MKLTLNTSLPNNQGYVDHDSSMVALGSCFTESIGGRLAESQFKIDVNPYGIIFNPKSILNALSAALSKDLNLEHMVNRDDSYLSYDYHSVISANDKQSLIELIETKNTKLKKDLKSCTHLIVTFGTAWVYKLLSTDKVIANCHKADRSLFTKVLLSNDELIEEWRSLIISLQEFNPGLRILFTVSPVRHSKDGLRENNVSKAILHQLAYELEKEFGHISYFPSYEIMLDELRDYRYYKEDLVHPSDLAIDYIFEKFQSAYLTEKSKEIVRLSQRLIKAKQHKFMNASNQQIEEHRELIEKLQGSINQLKA